MSSLTKIFPILIGIILFPILMIVHPGTLSSQEIIVAFPHLVFNKPVDFQHSGDDSNRLFIVEQRGVIRVFENISETTSSSVFLDITSIVDDTGNEEGLLGLAFHPDFKENGYFYVNYTADSPNRTVIARYRVSANNPDQADPTSSHIILEVSQPYSNHNGGQIAFGPDGFLYIAFGDGGSGGDPQSNGQNRATLLGSIVRIDVDNPGDTAPYSIPQDNPFANNTAGYREEIFAWGLRNPWRFSFDAPSGRLWAADVGQNRLEEINVIVSGGNYGWNIMEGSDCYNAVNCNTSGLILPVMQYDRTAGRSVTGGYVYRGQSAAPELTGDYIYADYVSGTIWALKYVNGSESVNRLIVNSSLNISSFGIDNKNELYALDHSSGKIYKFKATPTGVDERSYHPPGVILLGIVPNPFNFGTIITINQILGQNLNLVIYNSTGQVVRHLTDGYRNAGIHSIYWNGNDDNGRNAGAGLYLYRIESSYSILTGTMMLLK